MTKLNIPRDIRSMTDFKRNTPQMIKQMSHSGQPMVLTVNGRAQVVVQDAASYQRLLDALDRAEAVEGVRRGMADMDAGRHRPAKVALDQLRRQLVGRRKASV